MNYKQQKRIKNTALMVRNVLNMSDNMQKINLNYASDLEEFINKLKDASSGAISEDASSINKVSSGLEIIPAGTVEDNKTVTEDSAEESDTANRSARKRPEKTKRPPPPWAKDLYRKIMKTCHPDRNINSNLSPEEQIYRSESLQVAMNSYKEESFDELIYAAAIVDVYSERLPVSQQIAILNKHYGTSSKTIESIQTSISWSWGVNWDTIESRIQLIMRICMLHNIKAIPKDKLIVLLIDHEMK